MPQQSEWVVMAEVAGELLEAAVVRLAVAPWDEPVRALPHDLVSPRFRERLTESLHWECHACEQTGWLDLGFPSR